MSSGKVNDSSRRIIDNAVLNCGITSTLMIVIYDHNMLLAQAKVDDNINKFWDKFAYSFVS